MTIRNTQKDDPVLMLFQGSEGIERQEAQGQAQLVLSSQLPADGLTPEDAARCHIQIVKPSDGDPLFVDVVLPKGWTLQRTEHSMWSDLVDESGTKRAAIFYKAAFYDRRAFIRFEQEPA